MCSRDTALLLAAAALDMPHTIVRISVQTQRALARSWQYNETLSRTAACKEHTIHEHTRRLSQWPKRSTATDSTTPKGGCTPESRISTQLCQSLPVWLLPSAMPPWPTDRLSSCQRRPVSGSSKMTKRYAKAGASSQRVACQTGEVRARASAHRGC